MKQILGTRTGFKFVYGHHLKKDTNTSDQLIQDASVCLGKMRDNFSTSLSGSSLKFRERGEGSSTGSCSTLSNKQNSEWF